MSNMIIGTGLSDEDEGLSFQIHIRIAKRSARKATTLVENLLENLDPSLDHKKLLQNLRKTLNCSVSIATSKDRHTGDTAKIIKLSGDQRRSITEYLCRTGICQDENIMMHGF